MGMCKQHLDEGNIRRTAVILPQLQAAAVALEDDTHLPMVLVEGINSHDMEQMEQPVLLCDFSLLAEPDVRESVKQYIDSVCHKR